MVEIFRRRQFWLPLHLVSCWLLHHTIYRIIFRHHAVKTNMTMHGAESRARSGVHLRDTFIRPLDLALKRTPAHTTSSKLHSESGTHPPKAKTSGRSGESRGDDHMANMTAHKTCGLDETRSQLWDAAFRHLGDAFHIKFCEIWCLKQEQNQY